MSLQGLSPTRFWAKVDVSADCWVWLSARNGSGYGQFEITSPGDKRWRAMAHRFAYEALVGPIPEGLELDHLCRNRRCVNPAHLEPVTGRANLLRGEGCGTETHCINGHEYTPENTYMRGSWRRCRQCNRTHCRDYRRRLAKEVA